MARGEAGAACWDLKLGAPAVVALPSPIGRACPEATGVILGLTFEMGCTSGMYLLASGNLWLGESAHIAPLENPLTTSTYAISVSNLVVYQRERVS